MQSIGLLEQSLDLGVLLSKFPLQSRNFTSATSLSELSRVLSTACLVTSETLNLFLKTELFKDQDVCAVEDQGQKDGEAGEVHISLRVELAGVDLCTDWATDYFGRGSFTGGLGLLEVDSVDTVETVDEQNQDEDKGDLGWDC